MLLRRGGGTPHPGRHSSLSHSIPGTRSGADPAPCGSGTGRPPRCPRPSPSLPCLPGRAALPAPRRGGRALRAALRTAHRAALRAALPAALCSLPAAVPPCWPGPARHGRCCGSACSPLTVSGSGAGPARPGRCSGRTRRDRRSLVLAALRLAAAALLSAGSCTFEDSACGYQWDYAHLPWTLHGEGESAAAPAGMRLRHLGCRSALPGSCPAEVLP